MKTFRELRTDILHTIRDAAPINGIAADAIILGNYSDIPTQSKFISIYVEPTTPLDSESNMWWLCNAEITVFCGGDNSHPDGAEVSAVETAEKILTILTLEMRMQPVGQPEFVDAYSNTCVVSVRFNQSYRRHDA